MLRKASKLSIAVLKVGKWVPPQSPGTPVKFVNSRPLTANASSRELTIRTALEMVPGLPGFEQSIAFRTAFSTVLYPVSDPLIPGPDLKQLFQGDLASQEAAEALLATAQAFNPRTDMPKEFILEPAGCKSITFHKSTLTHDNPDKDLYQYFLRILLESADLFGRNSTARVSTEQYTHQVIQSAFAINRAFAHGDLPDENRDLFDQFCFLILPAMKLCGFRILGSILANTYLSRMASSDRAIADSADLFFRLPVLQMERLNNFGTSNQHAMDRAMDFHLTAASKGSKLWPEVFMKNFRNRARSLSDFIRPYSQFPNIAIYDGCIADIACGNAKRSEELTRLRSHLFHDDGRFNLNCITNFSGLRASGVRRLSVYAIDSETNIPQGAGELTKEYFGKLSYTAGVNRNKISTYLDRRPINAVQREIDTPFLKAIETREPFFGVAYRYKGQPPIWLFPVIHGTELV